MGAVWAGGSDELPPCELDAAIIFAPAGLLVVSGSRAVRKGCRVVCGGIHMSDIPSFPYSLLWEERSIHSVANLTRADAQTFLSLAPTVPVRTETETFWMSNANEALERLRRGRIRGAAVLVANRCDPGRFRARDRFCLGWGTPWFTRRIVMIELFFACTHPPECRIGIDIGV